MPVPSSTRPSRSQISAMLAGWAHNDPRERDQLVDLIDDELRRLAHHYMRGERQGHTVQTTALVHEADLRLVEVDRREWRDRAHFFAMAGTIKRDWAVATAWLSRELRSA